MIQEPSTCQRLWASVHTDFSVMSEWSNIKIKTCLNDRNVAYSVWKTGTLPGNKPKFFTGLKTLTEGAGWEIRQTWTKLEQKWGGCGGFKGVFGGQRSRLRSSPPMASAQLWSSAFCLPFVYLAWPRCRGEGQWATRSTAWSEWGGAPLSAAPWTQRNSEGPWLRAQQATSGSKAQRKPLHLSNKRKCPTQSEQAASCWHHTSVISGRMEDKEGALQPTDSHPFRPEGASGGVSLLSPHSGYWEASSVSKLFNRALEHVEQGQKKKKKGWHASPEDIKRWTGEILSWFWRYMLTFYFI